MTSTDVADEGDGQARIALPAEISGYEHFEPSGGFVPWLLRTDSDEGLESGTLLALGGVLILAILAFLFLMRGREDRTHRMTEADVDEIFLEGPDEQEGH